MLNKKGSSLIELIISIALISVVLVFMIKLLVDLNDAETNNKFAKNNQINRAEIIRMIGNDLDNKIITNINDNSPNSDNLKIEFIFDDSTTATISATKNTFTYTSSKGTTRKWTIDGGEIYTQKAQVDYTKDNAKSSGEEFYALVIDIEIHTINEQNKFGNNNTLDDIIISYIGKVNDFGNVINCLGYNC